MGKGMTIKVSGLDRIQKKYGAIPENIKAEADAAIGVAAVDWEDRASSAAPVDLGFLKNSIKAGKLGNMKWEVVSGAPYSAFVEFGTITQVQVPAGLEGYASQFKGTGKRKNGGQKAQPFFFPHQQLIMAQLQKDLRKALKEATK